MDNKIKGIPSHEEYMAYVEQQGWNDWTDELWEELERTKRLTNRGTACSNWHIIANARNGVIMKCLGVTNTKKHKSEDIVINQITEEFPSSEMHYICYTDGYCNELEETHNGGAAYVILKNGEIFKRSNKGFLNTKNYRMVMLS